MKERPNPMNPTVQQQRRFACKTVAPPLMFVRPLAAFHWVSMRVLSLVHLAAASSTVLLVTPVALLQTSCTEQKTTAERFVELLRSVNEYPLCNADGCITEIKARENTVVATYVLPQHSKEFPASAFVNRAETSAQLKAGALRDFCGALQKDFPDRSMQWVGHYHTKDQKFLASVLMKVSECY